MDERAVNFVFLGEPLPGYAISSLQLAVRHSGVRVRLIGSEKLSRSVSKIVDDFVAIEDFYDPTEFSEVARRVSYPSSFRDGFWLKTLERFFILEQYMSSNSLQRIFHAELDQMLFNTDHLIQDLSMLGERGLFVPFHNANLAIASVFYSNSQTAFRSLLDSAHSGPSFPNEMTLIARWALANPDVIFALPTIASVANKSIEPTPAGVANVPIDDIHGIVDASQLGQWVAGNDPRNVPLRERPGTKFVSHYSRGPLTRDQLSRLRFKWTRADGRLTVQLDDFAEISIYNLHIHSKIHRWLGHSENKLDRLIALANDPAVIVLPGTRKTQIYHRTASFLGAIYKNPRKAIAKVTSFLYPRYSRR